MTQIGRYRFFLRMVNTLEDKYFSAVNSCKFALKAKNLRHVVPCSVIQYVHMEGNRTSVLQLDGRLRHCALKPVSTQIQGEQSHPLAKSCYWWNGSSHLEHRKSLKPFKVTSVQILFYSKHKFYSSNYPFRVQTDRRCLLSFAEI